jgi:hypothetical protein
MADPRTFTLIGEFKDGITPELQKINNQLATLKNSFANIGGKGARSSARDIGRFKGAVDSLNETLQAQNKVLRSTIEPMRQYRREVGKTIGALKKLDEAGGRSIAIERTNKALAQQIRLMDQLNARSPRQGRPMPVPRGGGGGYTPPPRGNRGGRGGGGSGAGPGGFHMAEFGFAYTLGSNLAQPIQNAIVQGFQIGVGFMTKPFEYFANRLGERMQDELSDLKAAGGFFSMAKRQESPFVKNFADAIQFTQENNKVMARLAASLPGKTQDYIEVAKRVSDSVARTVLNDRAATMKMAEQIRAGDIRTYGAKSITEMTGSEATRKTIQVLLGDLTKDTVLAGMGGRAGAGGAMGAYGLPQLSERMISQDEVSMGQMQRYSAIFSDPMIMDALQRNINKINATSKNSADRLKAIAAMYKEIVTPELVERYRRTLSGVQETFNTAIFGEETGLFGLGRKMEGLGIKFNEYGQMIDKFGNVTTDLTQAAREDLAIYDLFRDILVNVGQVLAPIVENLSMIYDPLKSLGIELNEAREVTYRILQSFNYYKKGFEEFGKQFKGTDKEQFDATRDLRAALATIGNVMRYFKVIGEGDFAGLIKKLEDPKANMGQILQGMVDQFLKSDVAAKIGGFIGTIIGTVLTEVSKVTGFLSGRVASSNKLFEGLKKGFEDSGGPAAFRAIFRDVFTGIGKLLLEIAKVIPLEAYMLAAAMVVLPAAAQGLGMALAQAITGAMGKLGKNLNPLVGKGAARVTGSGTKAGGGFLAKQGANATKAGMALPGVKGAAALATKGKMAGLGVAAAAIVKLATMSPKLTKVGNSLTSIAKSAPGLNIAFAAADFAFGKMSGESTAQAAGGAGGGLVGGVIGAAIGTAMAPGIGTAIGSVLGTLIGDWLGTNLGNEIGKFFSDPIGKLRSAIDSSKKGLSQSEESLRQWFWELPGKFGAWTIEFETRTDQSWASLGLRFDYWRSQFSNWIADWSSKTTSDTNSKLSEFSAKMKSLFRDGIDWNGMATTLSAAVVNWLKNVQNNVQGFLSNAQNWFNQFNQGRENARRVQDSQSVGGRLPSYDPMFLMSPKTGNPVPEWKGGLGDAVRSELKNKPSGSNLVIANSSETVIPAAGGYGMVEFVDTLKWGFATMISTFRQGQQKQDSTLTSINQTLKSNQQQTNTRLSAMEKKFTTPGVSGGLGGAAAGGVDAFTPIAQRMGLTMTSGYRPGDPGWHGANRARDFSNGTGPTPQMMQFAQYMASTYGSNLKELIYTPLGFSIKNGQRVAPYAQGAHYNHVHVAYGLGAGNPAFFGSQSEAERWERSMVSGSVRVGSVTGNSAEGFGATINGGINVTVNAGATNDPDQLAYMVAVKIQEAVGDAVNSNILV